MFATFGYFSYICTKRKDLSYDGILLFPCCGTYVRSDTHRSTDLYGIKICRKKF